MQKDMHYHGTYAMALAAGIPAGDAAVIAYAAQFVDDATTDADRTHEDGGYFRDINTAHHPYKAAVSTFADNMRNQIDQRTIWVPFHFLPGGAGDTFHEKLLCLKDGPIAREMLENHLGAHKKAFALELIGVAAHVYADTFSHYGFSGMTSPLNGIARESFQFVDESRPDVKTYLMGKMEKFFASKANIPSLGHGSVATMPDRPFLRWRFTFEANRPGNGYVSVRDNVETTMEAREKLHRFFLRFSKLHYSFGNQRTKVLRRHPRHRPRHPGLRGQGRRAGGQVGGVRPGGEYPVL